MPLKDRRTRRGLAVRHPGVRHAWAIHPGEAPFRSKTQEEPMKSEWLVGAALMLLAIGIGNAADEPTRRFETDILRQTFKFTESTPSDVSLAQLKQGCPARDCIPAIDRPQFVGAAAADFMDDDDLVLGIATAGVVRAYPAFILNRHEIVNDVISGTPVAVTWCPLCGSGLAFERVVAGKTSEFGVSGVLNESDLVMYDRNTDSLWQQISGRAFIGPSRGRVLKPYPMAMATWAEWLAAHPDTEVLSTETGFAMDYSVKSPYGSYADSDRLMFPVSHVSQLARPKEVVYGVRLESGALAVTEALLRDKGQLEVAYQGALFHWKRADNGLVEVTRSDTGEKLLAHRMYWFAWYTFNPDTLLHRASPVQATQPAR
jgi:hypothetical protein